MENWMARENYPIQMVHTMKAISYKTWEKDQENMSTLMEGFGKVNGWTIDNMEEEYMLIYLAIKPMVFGERGCKFPLSSM